MNIKLNIKLLAAGCLLALTKGFSQDSTLVFSIDTPTLSTYTAFSFITFEPGFGYIDHTSDEEDTATYRKYSYLINQQPTERNYKQYIKLANSLWNLEKINEAEKMFLAIINSRIEPFITTRFHHSGTYYGYGSFTSNYKNTACIYLCKINIEKKKYKAALTYLNKALNEYEVYYTCGTGSNWQQKEYLFLKAACMEGLDKNEELIELLLPDAFDWDNQILVNAIKKLYTKDKIKRYLSEGEKTISCVVDCPPSYAYRISNSGQKDERTDTLKYYSGKGTITLFNRTINFPYPNLEDGETLTKDYFIKLFKNSSFYRRLSEDE